MKYNNTVQTRSVYIHWPFCPYRCHFCPFVALASHDQYMERYHAALCAEIEAFGVDSPCQTLDTVYMGGGTPSTYPPDLLLDMFSRLKRVFSLHERTEVTLEVNPGTVTTDKLAVWKQAGINRISMGVQSLKEKSLHALNRMQTTQDVYRLLEQAQGVIDNVSVDFILGLPGVSPLEWKNYLLEVVTWPITHISIYFLMVHEDTPLYFKVRTNKVSLPKDEVIVDLYHWSCDLLNNHGFVQYEVSNFAKHGHESRHNTVYWDRKPYKAFGLGACAFDGTSRFQNEKSLINYLQKIEQKESAVVFFEQLTRAQIRLEKIMLGVRRKEGIRVQELLSDLSADDVDEIKKRVVVLQDRALIKEVDGSIVLTRAGLIIENEIVRQLSL